MYGINLTTYAALISGTSLSTLAILEPQQLKDLNAEGLLAFITIASLGVTVYLVRTLVPAMQEMIKELAKLNATLALRPCIIETRRDENENRQRTIR